MKTRRKTTENRRKRAKNERKRGRKILRSRFLFLMIQYMCLKKLEQACSISRHLVYVSQKIVQVCSISRDLVYVSQKLEQACSISRP